MKYLFRILFLLFILNISSPSFAAPKLLCKNRSTSAVFIREQCRRYEARVDVQALGIKGSDGKDGVDGEDARSPYGDGSSGELNVITGMNLIQPGQYTTCNIAAGAGLVISTGILRCRDGFTNNGTVTFGGTTAVTQPPVWGGGAFQVLFPAVSAGVGTAPPGFSGYGQSGEDILGARGGLGFQSTARPHNTFYSPTGGGPASFHSTLTTGGTGALMIYSAGPIVNGTDATIRESSYTMNDGAGGPVIILASKVSVTNAGTIDARGHSGMNSNSRDGCGGGGGGGFVRFVAPIAANTGNIYVAGGVKGTAGMSTTLFPKIGGPGGGGSYGDGGDGCGFASSSDTPSGGGDGKAGVFFTSEIDPTPFL